MRTDRMGILYSLTNIKKDIFYGLKNREISLLFCFSNSKLWKQLCLSDKIIFTKDSDIFTSGGRMLPSNFDIKRNILKWGANGNR